MTISRLINTAALNWKTINVMIGNIMTVLENYEKHDIVYQMQIYRVTNTFTVFSTLGQSNK